jgi:hypothetical protein
VDPVPDPLILRKSGSAGNRTRTSGSVARNSAQETTQAVYLKLKLKLKLIYDRQSVGQSVLVSGAHLGPVTNFPFSLKFPLDSCGFVFCSALSD